MIVDLVTYGADRNLRGTYHCDQGKMLSVTVADDTADVVRLTHLEGRFLLEVAVPGYMPPKGVA